MTGTTSRLSATSDATRSSAGLGTAAAHRSGPSQLHGGEGPKYWLHVLTELRNRGVVDVRMVVCDGLTGPPDAIGAV